MSGLVGIWNIDGEPVAREMLSAMSARLAHRGPDGESLLVAGSAGFAHQMMRVTPESLTEVQPHRDPSGCILVWDGRLDNREELLAELAGHEGVTREVPDTSLVLAAYHACSDAFAGRLDGDFALALFDPTRKKLLLARDIMGGRTLYYCRFGSHFLFASEIKALLAHPAVRTGPDDDTVAEWLYRIPDYSAPARTFFKDIAMVLPGELLKGGPDGSASERFRDFDVTAQLRLASYEDYVEAYKEHFALAVKRRLRSAFPIAIAVSGGLDSSSIYCMAQELTRNQPGGSPKLVALCLDARDPAADETEFQQAVAEQYGIEIQRIPVPSARSLLKNNPTKAAYYSEGPQLRWQIWRDFSRLCVQNGARIMLSGHFGDHLLLNPQYLLDLVVRGRILAAYRHGKNFFQWGEGLHFQEELRELYVTLKGYLIPERLRPFYHRVRSGVKKGNYPSIPWYSERLVSKADYIFRNRQFMDIPPGRAHVKILYQHLYSRRAGLRADMELKMDSEFPCETVFPFRDRALVQLVMSLPGEVVYRSGSRGIHRDAMKGILPEKVRLRRGKANFDDPYRRGAAHDLDTLWTTLPSGGAARMGYLAPDALLTEALTSLRDQLPATAGAGLSWLASDLVALESWLSTFFAGETEASAVR